MTEQEFKEIKERVAEQKKLSGVVNPVRYLVGGLNSQHIADFEALFAYISLLEQATRDLLIESDRIPPDSLPYEQLRLENEKLRKENEYWRLVRLNPFSRISIEGRPVGSGVIGSGIMPDVPLVFGSGVYASSPGSG